MSATKPIKRFSECPNCRASLSKDWHYCPDCGQENQEHIVPFRTLVGDFFGDVFNFDSRFFHTLVPFFTRPGEITRDFLSGRRVRYVGPMRILIFGCLLLFAASSQYMKSYDWDNTINLNTGSGVSVSIGDSDTITVETDSGDVKTTIGDLVTSSNVDSGERPNRLKPYADFVEDLETEFAEEFGDSLAEDFVIGSDSWLELVLEQIPRLSETMTAEEVADSLVPDHSYWRRKMVIQMTKVIQSGGEGLVSFLISNGTVSVIMAVMMMALFLKLLYIRRKKRYVEHFVFSVHGHAALVYLTLLLVIVAMISGKFYQQGYLVLAPYYVLSLRRVYNQSWVKSFFKFVLLSMSYVLLLSPLLMMLALGLSFLFF